MKKQICVIATVIALAILSTTSFARDRVARLSRGHGGTDIVLGRTGSVLASGCITKVKDLHRVESDCDCDCSAPSYAVNGRCVRGAKGVDPLCMTNGWSRKHGRRETLHFVDGTSIHVHEDGLIDHDD